MKEENTHKVEKEFGLSNWSVSNLKTVFLIAAIIVLGGFISYTGMPKENFPELQIPEIYVGIAKPGSSPKVIEKEITKPIEKEINTIKNIDEISSTSIHGYATIRIKFDFSVNVDEALRKVKDAIDKARAEPEFPELPVEPNVFELDPSDMPILNINLRGADAKILKEVGEELQDRIEDLSEISEVDIRGVQEEEMRIDVDRLKAEAVNVSLDDIQNAISAEHMTVSGGELLAYGMRKSIRIEGEFADAEELKQIIVKQDDYDPVYLKDVADVYFGNADTTSYAREWGEDVIMLDIKKQAGKNLLDAADKIRMLVKKAQADGTIPANVKVSLTNDRSNKTRTMVSDLVNSIIFGIILVVMVLLFFLGLRNAIFVGIAIPLSMFMSFLILSAMGVTLNVMVLFSLVLALGMLVDNGIVVIENIYRLLDEGYDPIQAAKKGVGEVAWPIIASTATTLAAFIPLALWPGLMGEFMKYLPITLMIVLGSSLFVALVINPAIAAVFMRRGEKKVNKKRVIIVSGTITVLGILAHFAVGPTAGNILVVGGLFGLLEVFALSPAAKYFQNKILPILENAYDRFLRITLKGPNPQIFFAGTLGLLVISFILMAVIPPKVLFFPENEPNYVNIFIQHPIGTDIKETNKTTLEVEAKLNEILAPYLEKDSSAMDEDHKMIQSIIAQVGDGTSDPRQGVSMGNTPHKGRVIVQFAEFQYRNGVSTSDILSEINKIKEDFPADIQISAIKNKEGPPLPPAINIEVSGSVPYEALIEEADKIKNYLDRKKVKGVEKLKLDVETGKPEIPIYVDRKEARKLNASTGQISMAIRKALFGQDVSVYKKGDDNYDIVVRFDEENRNNLDALLDQKLIFRNNKGQLLRIPIRSVVHPPKEINSYSAVVRKDLVPMVTIVSDVIDANPDEVIKELKGYMQQYETEFGVSEGISYKFTGQQEEQQKEMAFLSKALMIAVFLILLIIVTQFNSYSTPTIIMFSVVFSLIGVLLGLLITGEEFVIIMTMIGIISLAGVVVNNAIVLIDYTNLIIERKKAEQGLAEHQRLQLEEVIASIVEGGKTRLRPVLLTAITTILGLIPLAEGINIDFESLFAGGGANFYIGGDNNMFFGPMSKTIIYGLTFATFLTLVIVPAMYLMLYRFKIWVIRRRDH
ncbi:MAG: efflux RND transporter permease subunit [Crocinitomicaceae bacterium]